MCEKEETGAITLEACVSVLTFLMLMLMLSGLFKFFMAQNATAHVLLQTTQSLSVDVYAVEKFGNGQWGSIGDIFNGLLCEVTDNGDFVEYSSCYQAEGAYATVDADAIKTRFIAYLAGGDEERADEYLRSVKVVDGTDGLDFSASYVENDTLYIVLKYELEHEMNVWNVDNIEVEQRACSKLWKNLE